jgi:hypothetical protein
VTNAWVTASNTITMTLANPTTTAIQYAAGTSRNPWVAELLSTNLANNASSSTPSSGPSTPTTAYLQGIPLSGTTGTITGTSLSNSCDSGTATITGAVVGSPVVVSSTTGADVGGAFNVRGSVTASGVVTVYVCGTGTPTSRAYNVRVIP